MLEECYGVVDAAEVDGVPGVALGVGPCLLDRFVDPRARGEDIRRKGTPLREAG
ncbi:hypothetical protein ACFC26_06840 [Kitasatospora purpeofusca]|uniref:hypothetical protein n=1 Tax=Kitasatospora purpeofusca TaxID=67352 RepID=UPI0035E359A3